MRLVLFFVRLLPKCVINIKVVNIKVVVIKVVVEVVPCVISRLIVVLKFCWFISWVFRRDGTFNGSINIRAGKPQAVTQKK